MEPRYKWTEYMRPCARENRSAEHHLYPPPYCVSGPFQLETTILCNNGWLEIGLFTLAAASGTFTALYLYVVGFNRIQNEPRNFAKYSNYFMAALMIVLVILTLIRMLYAKT